MYRYFALVFIFIIISVDLSLMREINAKTQFYFTVPADYPEDAILLFSVGIENKNYSWISNKTGINPLNNNTANIQADDSGMDLDANEYLLAIEENIDVGSRVYMCIFAPAHLNESLCQTDVIDKNNLARANFDLFS
jgi:hypothetical protein